ncbi:S9 family peptidase [Seonamhaeicola sp.]|uniref:S9 family peptidase n=1 Tax=Seonamhaeicola sp. TaxID=1912245 RepID=UPI0026173916|nr:S9 family peptidase [Seonamhaeicola sp.]
MRYLKFSFCVYFLLTSFLNAQNQDITLEEIWSGTFSTEHMDVLHSMANGQQYSVLNFDRSTRSTAIDIYDYETLKKVKTLVSSRDLNALNYFSDYTFSKDEQKVILATNETSVYRHSVLGNYFVYHVENQSLELISKELIQEPTFSPDGNKVAYGFNNNLYVKDLQSGATTQITFDGEKNSIINGITDWVYEEEFSFVRAFEWNADSNKIAFIRFDETNVPEFSMDVYGTGLYQTQHVFKYPKAGEANSVVSLHIYDLEANSTNAIKVGKDYNDFYIPRIEWTNNPDVLSAHYLNRHQNALDLWLINAKTNIADLVLAEKDEAYVDVTDNLTFLKDNSFIWTSEKDGYNHIYHYDKTGKLINQVTKGNWEVTEYYGYDEKTKRIFYQSVENGSINRDVYSIKLNGRDKKRLTKSEGTNGASFSADFSYFINSFSSATTPPEYTLNSAASGNLIKSIKDNDRLSQQLSNYKTSKKEFSTIHINGNDLNMWMIKPANFDASKQYPLLMYQYSGPGSQQVANRWHSYNDYWYQHLAQQGYIVACIDGRGTGFKGADFKKVTYMNLVKYETEDQIAAARKLGELPYVDKDRIGIWGWSFGGHMSTNCLLKGSDVFKMAIAVAPVTSWRFYDTIYTERYMRTPQENPNGYDDNSPFNYPEKLKGDYLLVHGSGDDNVHLQHTMRMVEALIQADKQFDWAVYPDKNHGIYGGNTRLHLYKKMTNFIHEKLGDRREKAEEASMEDIKIKG